MAAPNRFARHRLRLLVLLGVALVFALGVAVAGCGSDDDDASSTQPTTGPGAATTVPDVETRDLPTAAQQLADSGIRAAVEYVPSDKRRGVVIGQSRPPGTELQRGDFVYLNVSNGPNPPADVPVPDATEQTAAEGRATLEKALFEVLAINVPAVKDDIVVSHSPPAGVRIPRGSLVILYTGG
jgi:eukaryotic-like serine/threonine-protein kinase